MNEQETLELAAVAARLKVATDALHAEIAVIEDRLKELHLGVPGWVGSTTTPYVLGYARIGKRWGIGIRDTMEDSVGWLFTDAPRRARIEVMDQLPLLFGVLRANAAQLVDATNAAVTKARTVVAAIVGHPPL